MVFFLLQISFSVIKKFAQAASLPYVMAVVVGSVMTIAGNVGGNIWLGTWTSNIFENRNVTENTIYGQLGLGIYALVGLVFRK